MEACYKKYNTVRDGMLKVKYEFREENRQTLQMVRFLCLLRHNRAGIAS